GGGVVADFQVARAVPDDRDHVDLKRAVRPSLAARQALGELHDAASFGEGERMFARDVVAAAGFDLHEDDRAVGRLHDQVDLAAGNAGVAAKRAVAAAAFEVAFGGAFA